MARSQKGISSTLTPSWLASLWLEPLAMIFTPKLRTVSGCGYIPPRFCGCTLNRYSAIICYYPRRDTSREKPLPCGRDPRPWRGAASRPQLRPRQRLQLRQRQGAPLERKRLPANALPFALPRPFPLPISVSVSASLVISICIAISISISISVSISISICAFY